MVVFPAVSQFLEYYARGGAGGIKCVSAPLVIPDSVGRLGEVTLNGFEQVAVSWEGKNLGTNHTELDQLEARINIHHC